MFALAVQKNARLFDIHCLTGTPCARPGLRVSLHSILEFAISDTLRGADPWSEAGTAATFLVD